MSERLGVQGQATEGEGVITEEVSDSAPALQALADAAPTDAFAVLGPHLQADGRRRVRVLAPGAEAMGLIDPRGKLLARMQVGAVDGVFEGELAVDGPYRLRIVWPDVVQEIEDPYAFAPTLDESLLLQIAAGDGQALRSALGAQHLRCGDVPGVRFAVWAPHAQRVAVVGDFNGWDTRRHPMRQPIGGVWELFLPRVEAGARYKYAITAADGRVLLKADPVARQSELPPATASVVPDGAAFAWTDAEWMAGRAVQAPSAPLSIYEVHAASWRRDGRDQPLDWPSLARELIPYVQQLGFTHIELLPITEHPFGGSWGYQPLGLYAPTARHGSPDGFAHFVDACHRAGIGVILDWVSAHFPSDAHGLAQFDGAALYEHADPREGMHRDWNTLIYNYGRPEVTAFLQGSALEWIDHYHLDGLRVDAVASMLYRDYGRAEGEWVPNAHGGRENLEAVAFLRQLNSEIATRFPGVLTIAEESTAWPGVTAPISEGGLGFTHKWNMGWMHDTLSYMQRDPAERAQHHSQLTFGLVYAFSERFVLPLSHDEVVHGTGGLLGQMPGDDWRRFANLRAYLALMWAHPGDKLLFMGAEFGQWADWNHDRSLDWHLLDGAPHRGVQQLVSDLNATLRRVPALYRGTHRAEGFDWSVADDARNSVLAFIRHDPEGAAPPLLAVSNLTPQPLHDYRVGVPRAGIWREILNTDSAHYGGSNLGNSGRLATEPMGMHGHTQRLRLTLPPLATIYLQAET